MEEEWITQVSMLGRINKPVESGLADEPCALASYLTGNVSNVNTESILKTFMAIYFHYQTTFGCTQGWRYLRANNAFAAASFTNWRNTGSYTSGRPSCIDRFAIMQLAVEIWAS